MALAAWRVQVQAVEAALAAAESEREQLLSHAERLGARWQGAEGDAAAARADAASAAGARCQACSSQPAPATDTTVSM